MRLDIRMTALFALLFSSLFYGCTTAHKPTPDMALIQKIQDLEQRNKELKEKAIINRGISNNKVAAAPDSEAEPLPFNDEHSLYQASLEAYWKKDSKKLKRLSSIFTKTFPKSALADNVLYLKANLDFSKEDIRSALETLNQLVDNYPLSNKRVSADLLRAVIFSRLNLVEQSQEIFHRIVRQYPGSFEAKQAKLQIRSEPKTMGRR